MKMKPEELNVPAKAQAEFKAVVCARGMRQRAQRAKEFRGGESRGIRIRL
jgi:hypothetical protein